MDQEGKRLPERLLRRQSNTPDPEQSDSGKAGSDSQERTSDTQVHTSDIQVDKTASDLKRAKTEPVRLYYDYAEHISKPRITSNYELPEDDIPVLSLAAAFGYDSHRRNNLHVLDRKTLLLVMGTYLRLHRLDSNEDTFLRCTGSGSITCVAVAYRSRVFASAESGVKPDINIFSYPSCKLLKVLKDGTQKRYEAMAFEPNSEDLLATQGGEPDYNITIWNWMQESPLVRRKSAQQDVYYMAFSNTLFGHLGASGEGHVRFWTMADTFTGLKLQYQTGRFGINNSTNIEAFVQLSDGKVLSGSEEGKILLWQEALLTAQFVRTREPNCHQGKITQITLHDYEVITLGEDGYIRSWKLDTMRYVEPDFNGQQFTVNALLELKLGENAGLMYMVHADPEDHECFDWYVQDKKGKIWTLDLVNRMTSAPPHVLLNFHGGPVVGCAASHNAHLVATAGHDGTVRIFDCLLKTELLSMAFTVPASCLVWVPLKVDEEGASMIVGFDDGVVRKLEFSGKVNPEPTDSRNALEGTLSQVFKTHKSRVTSMIFSGTEDMFVTGGKDKIIFLYKMQDTQLLPLAWLSVPTVVRQLVWTPKHFSRQGFLAVCEEGLVIQILIEVIVSRVSIAMNYEICNPKLQFYKFQSIKSEIQHVERMARLTEELSRLKANMSSARTLDRTAQEKNILEEKDKSVDDQDKSVAEEDITLLLEQKKIQRQIEEEEKWQPCYPEQPSPALQAVYSQNEDYFWLTLGGYDAGYVYLCRFPDTFCTLEDTSMFFTKPEKAVAVPECSDTPITVMKIYEAHWQTLALMGFQNGHVRLVQLQQSMELDNLSAFWDLNVHDEKVGSLTGMEFAFDRCYLVTTGMDGNILMFSYTGLLEMNTSTASIIPLTVKHHDIVAKDISGDAFWFPDEIDQRHQQDIMAEAEARKKQKRQILNDLHDRLLYILSENKKLPSNMGLSREELLVNTDLQLKHMDKRHEKIMQIHREYAFEMEKTRIFLEKAKHGFLTHEDFPHQFTVKAFSAHAQVNSYRARFFGPLFEELLAARSKQRRRFAMYEEELTDSNERSETHHETAVQAKDKWMKAYKMTKRRSLEIAGTAGRLLRAALLKATEVHKKRYLRTLEWEALYEQKKSLKQENPEDLQAIEDAKKTLGDIKLKTDPLNAMDVAQRSSKTLACNALAWLDKECCERINVFNIKLLKLREEKITVLSVFDALNKRLEQISGGKKSLPRPPHLSEEEIPETKVFFDERTLWNFLNDINTVLIAQAELDSSLHICRKTASEKKLPLHCHTYYNAERSAVPYIVDFTLKLKTERDDSILRKTIPTDESTEDYSMSALEKERELLTQLESDFEMRLITIFLGELMDHFDRKVMTLRRERSELDLILKEADLQYISKLEEFLVNKKIFAEEMKLDDESRKCNQERQQNIATTNKIRKEIAQKNEDIELASRELADLFVELQCQYLVKVGPEFQHFFTSLYKRRTSKKKRSEEELDEDEEMSESESFSLSSFSGSASVESLDLDHCPDEIEPELYNGVVELQRRRQFLDDRQIAAKQDLVLLQKDLECITKEGELLKRGEERLVQRLQTFCLEKTKMINDIIVVVPLQLSQIYSKLSSSLVIDRSQIHRLQSRVGELKKENKAQLLAMNNQAQKNVQVRRENRQLSQHIASLTEKCDVEILKKFGKLVDIEELQLAVTNPKAEQLKHKLYLDRLQQIRELNSMEKEILAEETTLNRKTLANTDLCRRKLSLLEEKNRLEERLDQRFCGIKTLAVEKPIRREIEKKLEMASFQHLLQQQHNVIHDCWEIRELLRNGHFNNRLYAPRFYELRSTSASPKNLPMDRFGPATEVHAIPPMWQRPRLPKISAKL